MYFVGGMPCNFVILLYSAFLKINIPLLWKDKSLFKVDSVDIYFVDCGNIAVIWGKKNPKKPVPDTFCFHRQKKMMCDICFKTLFPLKKAMEDR